MKFLKTIPLLLLSLVLVSTTEARTFWIDSTEGTILGDGSINNPWISIDNAVMNAEDGLMAGDVIRLASGFYRNKKDIGLNGNTFPINLSAGVSLIGDSSKTVVLDAGTEGVPTIEITDYQGSGTITIQNISIRHNQGEGIGLSAYIAEGSLDISSCLFTNNALAMHLEQCNATVQSCEVTNNRFTAQSNSSNLGGTSGGIICGYDSDVKLSGNYIAYNTGSNGGGIYVRECSAEILDNDILHNTSTDGGGINCVNTRGEIIIQNNRISSNTSNSYGGGIFGDSYSKMILSDNIISGNTAIYGAGVCCRANSATMTENTIQANIATLPEGVISETIGGGVYVFEEAKVLIANCDIISNTVENSEPYYKAQGGGIACRTSQVELVLQNNIIEANSAKQGGGICVEYAPASLNGNTIKNNHAFEAGGGVFISTGNVQLVNNTIENNLCQLVDGNTIGNPMGGGVYCWNWSDTVIKDNLFTSNRSIGGWAQGGGLMTKDSNTLTVSNNTFRENICEGPSNTSAEGGGAYFSENMNTDSVEAFSNRFIRNTCSHNGGGVYILGKILFHNNLLEENTTQEGSGAGVFVFSGGRVVYNTFYKNKGFGALSFRSPDAVAMNNIFAKTQEPGYGIYEVFPAASSYVSHNVFWENESGLYWDGDINTIETIQDLNALDPVAANLEGDPLFVDADHGDFQLQKDSLCIGAGSGNYNEITWPTIDFNGATRPGTSGYDIGAFQYSPQEPTSPERVFYVNNTGDVYADGEYLTPAADFAELRRIDKNVPKNLQPGDILALTPTGSVTLADANSASSVIGVYATKPGFLGGDRSYDNTNEYAPVAMIGIVPVKGSIENGIIQPGDLITLSSTPGKAMKAKPESFNQFEIYPTGTIIGKALTPINQETGMLSILITLQ
jgi:hypothetical protein